MIYGFKEYINNNIRESLYNKIENSDGVFDRKASNFTKVEIKKIDDFFDKFDPNYTIECKGGILEIRYQHNFIADIFKYNDEWFVLELMVVDDDDDDDGYEENDYVYYKCDQIEGLINLLEYLFKGN